MNNSTGTRPDPIAHLIAGGLAGFFTSILVHPLDVIRTRMQVHTGPGSRYSGVLDGLRTTVRTDGWRGLYAGLTPSLVGSGISWGLFMFFYDTFKHQNADFFGAGSITHVISAAEAGMLTATITNPIWLVKTRLELQSRQLPNLSRPAAIPYLGLVDCLKRIAREEGMLALYRGLVPSLWMCSHGAIQFTAYEALKSSVWLRDTTSMFSPSDSAHTFVLAGLAKMTAATATFPLSTVRSRIQVC
jgi:solute carrier family 25 folate transporter 32